MKDVKRLQDEHGVSLAVAKTAWDACCDGEWLAGTYPDTEKIDPWDGEHEDLRAAIEGEVIDEILKEEKPECDTIEEKIEYARTLAELAEVLNGRCDSDHLGDLDITDLPVYGGEAPKSTINVWSWDPESVIQQNYFAGPKWIIVKRSEL